MVLLESLLDPILSIQILCLLFLAILFLQSGLDKVFNYKGNFEWIKSHFAKSPLKNTVGLMFPTITLLEVAAGVLSLIGLISLVTTGETTIAILGAQLSALSIIALFFGQRIAQDYAGAGGLVGYFMVTLLSIYILTL